MFYWDTKGASGTLTLFTELTSVLIYRRMFLFVKINFAILHTKLVVFFFLFSQWKLKERKYLRVGVIH